MKRSVVTWTAAALAAAASLAMPAARMQTGDALVAKARGIHERVITLDTHDDINVSNFTADRNYTQRLENQVNLPKMKEGGLDVAFFIVYVGQGPLTPEGFDNAYKQALEKFDAIHRLTKEIAPDQIELALTADDVRRIVKSGKKAAMIGVENGYPIGQDIGRVKEFYDRGARYISLAHNGHSQLADSNTGEATGTWLHNGLSGLGKQVVAEANRLGIMLDLSHPSKAANMQAIALSKAPVIASHSSARALANHSRNLDDEQLQAIEKNGGVVQTVAFSAYLKTDSPERVKALDAVRREFGLPPGTPLGGRGGRGRANAPAAGRAGAAAAGQASPFGGRGGALAALSDEKRAELQKRLAEVNDKFPPPARATVRDFVDHIDYLVKTIGIDHVGISSDFDGGGGVDGWNDASETFNVTLELVRRGYTEEQIGKLWSGNLLRVLEEVRQVAAQR
jgi:membrane dipeptidase